MESTTGVDDGKVHTSTKRALAADAPPPYTNMFLLSDGGSVQNVLIT
jgi:hypothetical protein